MNISKEVKEDKKEKHSNSNTTQRPNFAKPKAEVLTLTTSTLSLSHGTNFHILFLSLAPYTVLF